MADKITVTSTTWYGTRVSNSFKSVFWGILLLIGSIILLGRNENRFVQQQSALNEGSKAVVETSASVVDTQLEGKLVYLNGETHSPAEMLTDEIFWITTHDLKLKREVQMYQWEEKQDTESKDNIWGSETTTTTYEYKKNWNTEAIDSSEFYQQEGHENPSTWEYEDKSWEKSPILVGVFTLHQVFVNQLSKKVPVLLKEQEITIPEAYKGGAVSESTSSSASTGENLMWTPESTEVPESIEIVQQYPEDSSGAKKLHIFDSHLYLWKHPSKPEIGDLKISFSTVKTGTVSVIGEQNAQELISYKTSNGKSIALLKDGKVSSQEMFENAHSANKRLTLILRLLGLFLMYIGFSRMFDSITTLAKVLPFLSSILGVGKSLVAFVLTLIFGLGTIAIAWLVVRPVIGIIILVIAIGGALSLVQVKKKSS